MKNEKIELTRNELESMMESNKGVGIMVGFAFCMTLFATIGLAYWVISIIW